MNDSHLVYLHGFGSSPRSTKGILIRDHFQPRGFEVHLPDLNRPSFEKLSPLHLIELVAELLRSIPSDHIFLVGSSFGGLIALQALKRLEEPFRPRIRKLALLAPALFPWDPGSQLVTADVEKKWKVDGTYSLFHFARGAFAEVHFDFISQLKQLDSLAAIPALPTLILHGTNDKVVSVQQSITYAARCANAKFAAIDDGHDLLAQPDVVLKHLDEFFCG